MKEISKIINELELYIGTEEWLKKTEDYKLEFIEINKELSDLFLKFDKAVNPFMDRNIFIKDLEDFQSFDIYTLKNKLIINDTKNATSIIIERNVDYCSYSLKFFDKEENEYVSIKHFFNKNKEFVKFRADSKNIQFIFCLSDNIMFSLPLFNFLNIDEINKNKSILQNMVMEAIEKANGSLKKQIPQKQISRKLELK